MKSLLFACTLLLLFVHCFSGVIIQKAKLGSTAKLMFGDGVMDIEVSIPGARIGEQDRKHILKTGKITDYGRKKYGDRLAFRNGTLIIKNLQQNDSVTYFFSVKGDPRKPAAIDLEIN